MMQNQVLRNSLLVVMALFMAWIGYQREESLLVVREGRPTFISRERKEATNYNKIMSNLGGFKVPDRLQSSIFFSLIYLGLATAMLYLFSGSAFVAKLTAGFYLSYMVLCFVLIRLGSMGVDYRLSIGLSHYLEDLFLSPFFVFALGAVVRAFGIGKQTEG